LKTTGIDVRSRGLNYVTKVYCEQQGLIRVPFFHGGRE